MTNHIGQFMDSGRTFSRDQYLTLVRASLEIGQIGFGRQAILNWLSSFPGDLEAGLLYAVVLLSENRFAQSIQVLRGILVADPEFLAAARIYDQACESILTKKDVDFDPSVINERNSKIPDRRSFTRTLIYALGGEKSKHNDIEFWGEPLRAGREAIALGNISSAEEFIRQSLDTDQPALAGISIHLRYLDANREIPLSKKLEIAQTYNLRWPDCLTVKILLAHWMMESSQGDQAVLLLHEAASRDMVAQVPKRIWNGNNPYQDIWPTRLSLALDIQIPAEVISYLGLNRLSAISVTPTSPQNIEILLDGIFSAQNNDIKTNDRDVKPAVFATTAAGIHLSQKNEDVNQDISGSADDTLKASKVKIEDELNTSVRNEIERLAVRRKLPGVTGLDGRYPVYVVFSLHSKLVEYFGEKATAGLEKEMKGLVKVIQSHPRWGAMMFIPDESSLEERYGIQPLLNSDPWKIKLALADLDNYLSKKGAMIGALLIVGGPNIVPFHHLPNPVDDQDVDVPSDNPYGTRDENFFITEWPVGRLPDGGEKDASLILHQLQRIKAFHLEQSRNRTWFGRSFRTFSNWLKAGGIPLRKSFGYTAAIWKPASLKVFQPIGDQKAMLVSPPLGFSTNGTEPGEGFYHNGNHNGNGNNNHRIVSIPRSQLGYFNLHGLQDASEWYGQSDPIRPEGDPDYPVALRPLDVNTNGNHSSSGAPRVVFSEACYGVNIIGKALNEAISLEFLHAGTLAIVGSTSMSYGSISPPLIAADLLGQQFWTFLQEGLPAGEALKQAKISLVAEMSHRQGYLDGEDQKTLISFILYGDPLANPFTNRKSAKSIHRRIEPEQIKIVCDRLADKDQHTQLPEELMVSVKEIVRKYLPGMVDADFAFCHERSQCQGNGHVCPSSQLKNKNTGSENISRSMVTLSKNIQFKRGYHPRYARLTLDSQGKLLKLVVSR